MNATTFETEETTMTDATVTVEGREFRAPGPGSWELDAVHFGRPLTRWVTTAIAEPFARGFSNNTATYGLTLDRFQPAPQHGIWYHRAVPFGAPEDVELPPPTREQFEEIIASPAYAERLERGRRNFEKRHWREEIAHWDAVVKPRSIAAHLSLQHEDLVSMSDDELVSHLDRVKAQLEAMWTQHHDYSVTALLPVGDYLAHARAWTGLSFGELLRPLRGSSPVSRGAARNELDQLVLAIHEAPHAAPDLDGDPSEALSALVAAPEPVGSAARAWLETAGHRSLGYDVADPYALEMPGMMIRALKARLHDAANAGEAARAVAAAERFVRDRVPAEHHAMFDELLAEARFINRLRDERGNYSDSWATGLARRALLEAGRRVAERGRIADAALVVEATHDEVIALLRGAGPSAAELEEHRRWRLARPADAFPAYLGKPPAGPPPADWLPEGSRRIARAVEAAIEALFGEPEGASSQPKVLTGLSVSPGTHEGIARIVKDGSEFGRLKQGDVLVARSTSATFNVVLPLLGAIVTDRGGQLCHAAIVAREAGIPAVVGTKLATTSIPDGARVRVNGDDGTVTVLS